MQNVLSKLALARLSIKSKSIKKDGKNSFSNYDYFTPELVAKLVNDACIEANIICVFNLKSDSLGYYGEIITTDLDNGGTITTIMRTEKPSIKATNETQQMGGMNTYTKRYALMSLFDIEDNSIDFDSDTSAKSRPSQSATTELPWLNENTKEFDGAVAKLQSGETTIEKIKTVRKLSKKIEALLIEKSKQPQVA